VVKAAGVTSHTSPPASRVRAHARGHSSASKWTGTRVPRNAGFPPMILPINRSCRWRRQTEASDFGQPTAAVTRWRVSALPSARLPVAGVGRPRWLVELIRCCAGESAGWRRQWRDRRCGRCAVCGRHCGPDGRQSLVVHHAARPIRAGAHPGGPEIRSRRLSRSRRRQVGARLRFEEGLRHGGLGAVTPTPSRCPDRTEEFSAPLISHPRYVVSTIFKIRLDYTKIKVNILTVVERWKSRQWMISMRSLPWGRLPRKPASRCSGCWSPAVLRGCRLESSQNAWVFSLPHFLSISRSSFMPALSLSDA